MAKSKGQATRGRSAPARRRAAATPLETALAGLAHDIRTPLGGILAMAELLQASDLPERERQWAETIRSTADHLAQLTTLVVETAQAGAGRLVLRAEPFSPRALAQAAGASLSARAAAKGLAATCSIARQLPASVVGDPLRLRAALENLIDNAVKFTERGRVALKVTCEPATRSRVVLRFAVTDSGIGMVAADRKRLFRPFTQANADIARRYGGAGLGLVSVKRIARAMAGDVTVASEPGRGSTFTLSVTLALGPETKRPRGGTARPASAALSLLCVEDNPYGRAVLKTVLEALGHRVTFAADGETAVRRAAEETFDAILMDLTLPGISGIETARRIRALAGARGRVPLFALSGRSEAEDVAATKAAGFAGFLPKPATAADLHAALGAVRPRARRAESDE